MNHQMLLMTFVILAVIFSIYFINKMGDFS